MIMATASRATLFLGLATLYVSFNLGFPKARAWPQSMAPYKDAQTCTATKWWTQELPSSPSGQSLSLDHSGYLVRGSQGSYTGLIAAHVPPGSVIPCCTRNQV